MTAIRPSLIFGLLALLVPIPVLRAQESQEKPEVAIAITAVNPTAVLGADVTIVIKMTNVSNENLAFIGGYHGSVPDGYGYEIQNEQGGLVQRFGPRSAMMPNGQKFWVPTTPAGSKRWGEIVPGQSTETRATLNYEYNFDHPGTYTIRVCSVPVLRTPEEMDPSARGVGKVCSNTVTIKLLPSDGSSQSQ